MIYTKPPKTYKELAATLLNRGLISEESDLIEFLRHVTLFQEHQDIDLIKGTFPVNRQSSPLWQTRDQDRGTT